MDGYVSDRSRGRLKWALMECRKESQINNRDSVSRKCRKVSRLSRNEGRDSVSRKCRRLSRKCCAPRQRDSSTHTLEGVCAAVAVGDVDERVSEV